MSYENIKQRTKQFALSVIAFVESLPKDQTCPVLGRQLLRSGTSVAANYRSACRAKSPSDFISKMGNVEEEADESAFWLELLIESGNASAAKAQPLLSEGTELLAITVASINTARKNAGQRNVNPRRSTPHSAPRTPHS